ncbi:serine hydrolase domain-containing protein [Nocardia asteroides]|uniref:serine hydrolase domain-containing protein n=1 Tax=Nocardia asteroides TaxID=1824 RepID=UPI001E5D0B33|nr:serine hydrolase [Nocardia asteroides]UGT57702.1 beta-lactamase family protein [Nocardia asteroides]
MHGYLKYLVAAAVTALTLSSGALLPGPARAEPVTAKQCEVTSGRTPQSATPAEAALDPARLGEAMQLATNATRFNIQIYRNNCLVGVGPRNAESGGVAWNLWSGTKSVVALVAGLAVDDGRLRVDEPIGAYLPAGLGDEAHRAITVRNLLTESSGMEVAVAAEGATGLAALDPNVVAQALAMPIERPQGTMFRYSQRAVDLLVYVIQQAIGEDFQDYAQRKLFDPLGIPRSDYFWARDRAGNTYGHAHLILPPDDFAKIGLLVGNRGRWNDLQVISDDYMRAALSPSASMPCYGFLFVINGEPCRLEFPGLPYDAVKISGMLRNDSFIVPSLGLMVNWTGVATPGSSTYTHNVMRTLGSAFLDTHVPDPGPYQERPDVSVTDPMIARPDALLGTFGIGPYAYPGCSFVDCLGETPKPPFSDWPPGCVVLGCVGTNPATPGIR